ncbi:RHS repeat-associated core domain-containing protein [uncultured Microbulbifer sp.]|uniref:RHS repeat-associated core domain-containing protein n=1 Tax=uncultured Microbulbifer sp. TaxID=348147 RepID=UPI0026370E20|nr:RHS repeat-associated core domain-containing protein [uncultured Microbulbifer sp.]
MSGRHTVKVSIPKPGGITLAANNKTGAFTIGWGAAPGNPGKYQLRERKNAGSWATVYSGSGRQTSVSGRLSGVYEYQVRACYVACSGYTAIKAITVVRTPGAINLPGSSTSGSFTVSWNAVSGRDSYILREQRNGGSWSSVYTGSSTSKTLSGRSTGTYRYRVAAVKNGVTGNYKTSDNLIVSRAPGVPGGFTVPSSSADGIYAIRWNAVSGDGDITYRVEETGETSASWTQSGTSRSYTKTKSGTYSYRVRACSTYSGVRSCGNFTGFKQVNTDFPDFFIQSHQGAKVTLVWDAEWAGGQYLVLSRNSEQLFRAAGVENGVYIDTVPASGTYHYRLESYRCPSSECIDLGRASDSITIVLAPGKPTVSAQHTVSYDGNTVITSNSSGPINTVRWQKRQSGSWPGEGNYSTAASHSFEVTGLGDGTWEFRTKNCNSAGCSSSWSNPVSLEVWNQVIPTKPAIESLPNDDDGVISLRWTDLKNQDVYQYEIYQNGQLAKTLASDPQTPNAPHTYTLPKRSDGNYTYTVKAFNLRCSRENNCPTSSAVSVIVAERPSPPGEVKPSATFTRTGFINLNWGAAGGNVKYYEVIPGSANASDGPITWHEGDKRAHTDLQSLSRDYTLNDGFHAFKVRACNQVSAYAPCSGDTVSDIVEVAISEPPVAIEVPPHRETALPNTATGVLASDRVGIVGGEFRVTESGAANYTVPIITGPASGGAVPSVALSYNSERGNGLLGMGWSISGLSAITACRRTQEEDNVNGSAFDRYCLDGHRLKLISGTLGSVGSLYRPSLDSFIRVKLVSTNVGTGKGFEVYRKDGSISYYGLSEDAYTANVWHLNRQEDSAGNYIQYRYLKDADTGEHVIDTIYYAANASDAPLNEIRFVYDSSRSDKLYGYAFGESKSLTRRLTSVTSKANGTELRRYVPTYETGATGRLRMAAIEECVGDNCRPSTSFKYTELTAMGVGDDAPNTSLLSRNFIGGKAGDINGDGIQDLVWIKLSPGDPWTNDDDRYYFRIALGDGNGGLNPQNTQIRARSNVHKEWHLVDYNDDGKSDLLHVPAGSGSAWKVNLSLGSAFSGTELTTAIPYEPDQKGNMYDFNGDGLPDYLKIQADDGMYGDEAEVAAVVRLTERKPGGGLQFASAETTREILNLPEIPYPPGYDRQRVAISIRDNDIVSDLNNDGIADFSAIVTTKWICDPPHFECPNNTPVLIWNHFAILISSGTGSHSVIFQQQEHWQAFKSEQRFADINGDGLVDMLYRSDDESQWALYHFTGDNFVRAGTLASQVDEDPLLYDWNDDGLTDILYPKDVSGSFGTLHVLLNTPTGFGTSLNTGFVWGVHETDIFHYTLDLDGDGRGEILEICSELEDVTSGNPCDNRVPFAEKYLRILKPKHKNRPIDVLSRITDGFGVKTEIRYARLNDASSNVYTRTTGASGLDYGNGSPVFDLYSPMYVVQKVTSDAPAANNDANTVEVHYHYAKGRMQGGGRGFLGFEQVTSYDPQNQVKTTTYYRQDYPYIGMPEETAKVIEPSLGNIAVPAACSDTSQILISCSVNELDAFAPTGKTVFPYISKAIDKLYELDGTYLGNKATQTIYDRAKTADLLYGNVSEVIVENFDAAGNRLQNQTTKNNYNNVADSNRWHTGRLIKSTVTTERFGRLAALAITRQADFGYDPITGLLTDEWVAKGTGLELHTQYQHDRFGNRTSVKVTDAVGNSRMTRTLYDGYGRYATTRINALNQTTAQLQDFNAFGAAGKALDISGVATSRAYSQYGHAYFEYVETGSHSTTLKTLCSATVTCPTVAGVPAHYKSTTTGIDQTRVITYHDRLGREVRKQTQGFNGNPIYVDTQYDAQSRVKAVSEPHTGSNPRWSFYHYDLLGRTTLVDAPDGQCDVATVYNELSITVTNCGQSKTTQNNLLGEAVEITDAIGGKLQYSYYADGKLKNVKVLDSSGLQTALTSIEYDQLGRKDKMIDPDKGTWTYGYTGFGELHWQRDAKAQGTAMTYDALGRMITRADYKNFDSLSQNGDLQQFARWYYDQDPGCDSLYRFDGKLVAVAQAPVAIQGGCSPNLEDLGHLKLLHYDQYGRLGETTTSLGLIGGDGDFFEKVTYDKYSRAVKNFDASNQQVGQQGDYLYGVETVYNAYGYKQGVRDLRAPVGSGFYYTVEAMTTHGQVREVRLGNGLTTTYQYDPRSHRLTDILTDIAPGIGQIQNLHYDWYTIGNLMSKTDQSGDGSYQKSLEEVYQYDDLNRLRYAYLYNSGSQADVQEVRYDSGGNITFKTGVGNYSYNGPQPHAVTGTSIGSISYQYDNNGNLVGDGSGRILQYSVFDKPTLIEKGSHSTRLLYGPDRNRYKRVDDNGNGSVTTLQLGGVEKVIERTRNGSFVKAYYRRSLAGVAMETVDLDQSDQVTGREIRYLLKDLQGSLDVITTEAGQVAKDHLGNKLVYSFDPWGKRRAPFSWEQLGTPENIIATLGVGSFNHLTSNRGYTGHEMLDAVGLIHMNGRVYDPTLSRFVSADPVIDDVASVQGYNRYAYVHNNPLSYTDPSGYSKWTRFRDRWLNGRAIHYKLSQNPTLNAVVQVGVCIMAQAACPAVLAGYNAVQTYQVTGSWALAFKNGVLGGISAGAFAGMPGGWSPTAFALRGTFGGVLSVIGGGKFGHGFVSAGVGGGFGKDTQLATRMLVSGSISEATGGKFANGAATAAFAMAMGSIARSGTPPTEKPNITGSDKVAFVGGAGDGSGLSDPVVQDKYKAYIEEYGEESAKYFEWTDSDALSTYISDHKGRVTVVAHSYGADTATHIVAGGSQVYKLVTVDPVGWTRPSMQAIAKNAVIWNNYDSTGGMWSHQSNFIATVGGAWNSRPDGYATNHTASSLNHMSICIKYCRP